MKDAHYPETWGENPDESDNLCLPSGLLGRFSGQAGLVLHFGNVLGKKLSKCTNKQGKISFQRTLQQRNSQYFVKLFPNCNPTGTIQGRRVSQVSLADLGLNRWRAYLPSIVPQCRQPLLEYLPEVSFSKIRKPQSAQILNLLAVRHICVLSGAV